MPSVLDRDSLDKSPLADLHLIANELGVDGFRRLRKADLIAAIIAHQSGAEAPEEEAARTRARSRATAEPVAVEAEAAAEPAAEAEAEDEGATDEDAPARSRRGRRGGRGRARRDDGDDAGRDRDRDRAERDRDRDRTERDRDRADRDRDGDERVAEGVVELLGNGSAFIRLGENGDTSDDDVYISAAQVKRCELVSGDRISGPVRAPRRSERYPSLVRVDTINGRPAEEVAEGTRFEDLPATFPTERLALGSDDPTVNAVEWLTPFG